MVGVHWLLHKPAMPLHQLGLTSWLYLNAQAGSRVAHHGLGTILPPVGSTRVMPTTLLPALGSKVISSKSLSKELGLDPAPDLRLPGLALALVSTFLPQRTALRLPNSVIKTQVTELN